MKAYQRILLHLFIFVILGLIYFIGVIGFGGCRMLSLIYYVIIYVLVGLVYYYLSKKTTFLTKKKNKILLIITTIIASALALGTISGTVDYIKVMNGKMPIFAFKKVVYSKQEAFIDNEKNLPYSGLLYTATEHFGLGYKLVVCDSCGKTVYFMPLGIGTYEWAVGTPLDKLRGNWFFAHNNDVYMHLDGMGNYALSVSRQTIEEGSYIIKEDILILNSFNNKVANCIIKNNYHELHCDKYSDIFMK